MNDLALREKLRRLSGASESSQAVLGGLLAQQAGADGLAWFRKAGGELGLAFDRVAQQRVTRRRMQKPAVHTGSCLRMRDWPVCR